MSIRTAEELEKLRDVGKIVRLSLNKMTASVRSGIATAELDEIGVHVLAEHAAEAAPRKVYGFPGGVCSSANEEAVHGVPGDRVLRAGDLVKLVVIGLRRHANLSIECGCLKI